METTSTTGHIKPQLLELLLQQPSTISTDIFENNLYGRAFDMFVLESKLLAGSGCIELYGEMGVGKTSLIGYLEDWWDATKLVEEVIRYDIVGYDVNANQVQSYLDTKLEDTAPKIRAQIVESGSNLPGHVTLREAYKDMMRRKRVLFIFDHTEILTSSSDANANQEELWRAIITDLGPSPRNVEVVRFLHQVSVFQLSSSGPAPLDVEDLRFPDKVAASPLSTSRPASRKVEVDCV
jgi:hypothetical protein